MKPGAVRRQIEIAFPDRFCTNKMAHEKRRGSDHWRDARRTVQLGLNRHGRLSPNEPAVAEGLGSEDRPLDIASRSKKLLQLIVRASHLRQPMCGEFAQDGVDSAFRQKPGSAPEDLRFIAVHIDLHYVDAIQTQPV